MRFSAGHYLSLTLYFMKNTLAGNRRFPLVLMLEPTHKCNLACEGCDRIRLQNTKQPGELSLEQCLKAAKESGAPVVTVTGGEPLMYYELKPLIAELLEMKKEVYLCTNGLLTESFTEVFNPHQRLTLNFHVDGTEKTHDRITGRPGTFRQVIKSIRKAKRKGFRVSTNTSIYRNTDVNETEKLFELLKGIGVDGILVSPAFSYESIDTDIFLSPDEINAKFSQMSGFFSKYPFMSSPIYLDFLKGKRQMRCTPWGNPTRNPLGWKSPCYLITDSYYETFNELMEKTCWDYYESAKDPRCRNCMVHSGYEATVMRSAFTNPKDFLRLAAWNLKKT